MNPLNLMQQIIQFQKTLTDNSFRSMNLLIEHGERLQYAWLNSVSVLHGPAQETAALWLDASKTSRACWHSAANAVFAPFSPWEIS